MNHPRDRLDGLEDAPALALAAILVRKFGLRVALRATAVALDDYVDAAPSVRTMQTGQILQVADEARWHLRQLSERIPK